MGMLLFVGVSRADRNLSTAHPRIGILSWPPNCFFSIFSKISIISNSSQTDSRYSSLVIIASTRPFSFACTASQASPLATSSMFRRSAGRASAMWSLKATWMSSSSSVSLALPSSVTSPTRSIVRLCFPAVIRYASILCACRNRWMLGMVVTTPMLPTMAKGAAQMVSATEAIMYPPEAATESTQTVKKMPALRIRTRCDAANP
mmetsp:Transcript_2896/g.6050  ORF Transcript_2896/g.6050 Transcript_2896/m.6050 type:complete len:204 (+) Transcript_2896:232-843(+)